MNILKKKKGESSPVVKREYTHEMVLFILGTLLHVVCCRVERERITIMFM